MKIGAENRKELWALGVLGVVAAYFLYTNVLSNSGPAPAAKPAVSEGSSVPAPETAPETPIIKLDTDTMPSSAPSTAARSHPPL